MSQIVYDRRYVRRTTQILYQILLVTAIGALVRLMALDRHAIWLDEAISLEIVSRNSLPSLWNFLRQWDMHPPFYYQILLLWTRIMGDSLLFLRLPSVLASLLTVPAVYVFTMLLTRRRTAFLAALFFALSPYQAEVAQEARMYALLTLWMVMALIFLVALLRQERLETARAFWIGLAVCQAGAAYTHNTAGPYLAAILNLPVAWWYLRARRGAEFPGFPTLNSRGFGFNWVTAQVMVLLMWLPWSGAFWEQTRRILGEFWVQPVNVYDVGGLWIRFAAAHVPVSPEIQAALAVPMLTLAIWGLVRLRRQSVPLVLLGSALLVPMGMALLSELIRPLWHARSLNALIVPFYALVAIGIVGHEPSRAEEGAAKPAWRGRMVLLGQTLAVLVLCLLQVWGLEGYYRNGEREAWRRAAAEVARTAAEGDAVMFHANWVQLPFMYHYARLDGPELIEIPVPEAVFTGTVAEPKMTSADVPALQAGLPPTARVWLVYSHDWYTDPDGLVTAALEARLSHVREMQLPEIRILLYVP